MIDIKELRRLAQAATPHVGHACKYQDAHWLREGHVDFENADLFIASERPQEDAAFYAAANPAAVSELLDRLEAAEKELAELRSSMKFRTSLIGRTEAERDALRARIEVTDEVVRELEKKLSTGMWRALREENEALRAKIEQMEQQEPVTAQQRFQRQQEMMAVWLPWQTTELRKGRPARTVDVHGLSVEYRELYALPGAQPSYLPSDLAEAIIADMQAQYDSELITENDSCEALIRLDGAIAAVEDNFAAATEAKP